MKMSSLVFMSVFAMSQVSLAGVTYNLKPACADRIKKVNELVAESYTSWMSEQDKKSIQIIVTVDTNAKIHAKGDGDFAPAYVKVLIQTKDLTTGIVSDKSMPSVTKILDASLDCMILSVTAKPFDALK